MTLPKTVQMASHEDCLNLELGNWRRCKSELVQLELALNKLNFLLLKYSVELLIDWYRQ